MTDDRPALSLVLPAYNEQARLPFTLQEVGRFLDETKLSCEVIVVDNGSSDATSVVVQQAIGHVPGLKLIRTDRRGKGLAVRTGMLAGAGDVRIFADADLSWPVEALVRFPKLVSDRTPVVIGSREVSGARRVGEPGYRHLMGRVFNRLVQALAVPGIEDTQCGFKCFRADAADAIFSRQTVEGWAFDVEVLFLARALGYGVRSEPLRWEHMLNSRVAPVSDTISMVLEVMRVRVNAAAGQYSLRGAPRAASRPPRRDP